jgi:hypothetical protein
VNIHLLQLIDKATHVRLGDRLHTLSATEKAVALHLAINADAAGVCSFSPPRVIATATVRHVRGVKRAIDALAAFGAVAKKGTSGGDKLNYAIYTLNGAAFGRWKGDDYPWQYAMGTRGNTPWVPVAIRHGLTNVLKEQSTTAKATVGFPCLDEALSLGKKPSERAPRKARARGSENGFDLTAIQGLLLQGLKRTDARLAPGIIRDCRAVNPNVTGEQLMFALSQIMLSGIPPSIKSPAGWLRREVATRVRAEYLEALEDAARARMEAAKRQAPTAAPRAASYKVEHGRLKRHETP